MRHLSRSQIVSSLGLVAILALLPAQLEDDLQGGGPVAASPPALLRSTAPYDLAGTAPLRDRRKVEKVCPDRDQLDAAARWAGDRLGSVSFAIDDECGRLLGEHRFRAYYSASAVKAMLLVAYLRRDDVAGRELTTAEADQLGLMIEVSDNDAADAIFAGVGEAGLDEVAVAAGMRRFTASPFWGGSGITAGDQAAFMNRIEQYVPKQHERFALEALAGVVVEQRWGIDDALPDGWVGHFKGGWYPADDGWRVNQVATARRHGRSFGVAVLSEGNPDFAYGQETVRGVAERLLSPAARKGSRASARSRPRRSPPRPRR